MGDETAAVAFLRRLPAILRHGAAPSRRSAGGRHRTPPVKRILAITSLSQRAVARLYERLDCDHEGLSRRSGKPAWPESWDAAMQLVRYIGGEYHLVPLLASWLERYSPTTRRTYWYQAREILRELRLTKVRDLITLPQEAALTWQREHARGITTRGAHRLPRTVNTATAALNSLCHHAVSLGVIPSAKWMSVQPVKVTRGRHCDEEAIAYTDEQLHAYWQVASRRPRVVLLALMIASLHGMRRSEVAHLRVRDIRRRRRGRIPAPAVMSVLGKGSRRRFVQIHPAIRAYLEAHCVGRDPDAPVIADDAGKAYPPETVSSWAASVAEEAGLPGSAHALRSTWTTLALESKQNDALQVQQSGGWKHAETMVGSYFKRRKVPLIRIMGGGY